MKCESEYCFGVQPLMKCIALVTLKHMYVLFVLDNLFTQR